MPAHRRPDGTEVFCSRETFGSCRICDLIDPASPHYREGYRRLFFPGEFPAIESPVVPGPPRLPPSPDPRLVLVAACPHRGGVLPHPLQPEGCGCRGELSGCRAGKGKVPGRVTLRDCLACVEG